MYMKRVIKIILPRLIIIPLLFFILLVSGGFIIIKTMFNPANLRVILVNQLQEAFKRPVQITSANIALSGKIRIRDLKVLSLDKNLKENFVNADIIYVSYKIIPLLRNKISINKIFLNSPKIRLTKNADGLWNFSDIFENSKNSTTKLSQIRKTEIKNGTIIISGLKNNAGYTLKDVNLSVNNFKPDKDVHFSFSTVLKAEKLSSAPARFYCEGIVNAKNFNWTKAYIKNMSVNSSIFGKSATAFLSVNNFREPRFKLDFDTQDIKTTELALALKKPYHLNIQNLKGNIDAALSKDNKITINSSLLKTKNLAIRATGTVDMSASPRVPPFPKKTSTSTDIKYDLRLSANPFPLSELSVIFPKLPFKKPFGFGQIRININKTDDKTNLKRLFINTNKAGFVYKKIRFSNLTITGLISENIKKNKFTLKKGDIAFTKNRIKDLNIDSYANSKLFEAYFDGKWNNYKTKGILKIINPFTQKKSLNLTAYSVKINAKKLKDLILEIKTALPPQEKNFYSKIKWVSNLKNAIPKGYSLMTANIKADNIIHDYFESRNFYLSAKLRNFSGDVEKIKGDISIKSGAGTFFKVQETSEKDRIYNIVALPILMMFKMNRLSALKLGAKLKDAYFHSMGGDYSFDSGKIHIKNFFMSGKEFSAYSTGDLDLMNETMNLKVYTISNKYYTMGTLPQYLTDASGKPALAFLLKGKMNHPSIKMLNPRKSGKIINDAKNRGVDINTAEINKLTGGVK